MPQKIICFDLDGTLIDDQGIIHPADIEILASHRGSLLIPATGRTIRSVRQLFEKNGLFIGQPLPFPLVLLNGAALYTQGEHVVAYFHFEYDLQTKLIQLLVPFHQAGMLFFDLNEVYTLHENGFVKEVLTSLNFRAQSFSKSNHSHELCKVMCLSDNPEILEAVSNSINPLAVETSYSLSYALEISPLGVNKANAILQLVKILGVDDYLLYAVGDGENDLPMLNLANYSYAPITAPDHIRTKVDYAIDASVDGILAPMLG